MSTIERMIGILGFMVVLGTGIENVSGQCPDPPDEDHDCKCNTAETRWVCATFDAPGAPEEDLDFIVTYTGDTPRVEFVTPDDGWEVYSEVLASGVPTGPADLGDVLLASDVSPNNGNFTVKIAKSGGPWGAANVASLILDSTDAFWTGGSSIDQLSFIFGDVGDLTLIKAADGSGGTLGGLFMTGSVTGAITVARVTSPVNPNYIGGSVTGDILIEQIASGGILTIDGSIAGNLTVSETITAGDLTVWGNVPDTSTVHIAAMTGNSNLTFSGVGETSFDGDLFLGNGLSDTAMNVRIGMLDGEVDLNDFDVVGELRVDDGTINETIVRGGDVTGTVSLSYYPTKDFKGIATFASVPLGGLIKTWTSGELSGTLDITGSVAGTIALDGPFNSGGAINIGGSFSGDINIPEDCAGSVSIAGLSKGDVDIEGDLSGSVTLDDALDGVGRILVSGESSGAIKVGKKTGSLTLIQVAGGLATGATIEINTTRGNFSAGGDIHIGGPPSVPVPPVTFDSCIRIYDDAGDPPNGGDLKNDLTVVGCHANNDVLNICIDGSDGGYVTLLQTGCTPANATWSCSGCP